MVSLFECLEGELLCFEAVGLGLPGEPSAAVSSLGPLSSASRDALILSSVGEDRVVTQTDAQRAMLLALVVMARRDVDVKDELRTAVSFAIHLTSNVSLRTLLDHTGQVRWEAGSCVWRIVRTERNAPTFTCASKPPPS